MGLETERKFLVKNNTWRTGDSPQKVCQGYLSLDPTRIVRVRSVDGRGFVTIKGQNRGMARTEYEYQISLSDAREILQDLCLKPLIKKNRHLIEFAGQSFIVDEFLDENYGLLLAEIELKSQNEIVSLPDWLATEVTNDPKYFNSNLVNNPYCGWQKDER